MTRFYGIDDANARLTELRPLLEALRHDRAVIARIQGELGVRRRTNGSGEHAEALKEREAEVHAAVARMRRAVERIAGWDVTLRDIDSGLIDFPALVSGRQIWLCWRLGEDAVHWWHELSSGFGGRRPLGELA